MARSHYRWVIVVAGGLIYDTCATWLYAGSFGLLAFLIAMIFRPFAKPEKQPCPA
jgi:hypothetical protein